MLNMLDEYKKKRRFEKTPEPSGTRAKTKRKNRQALRFVVQKHQASHLHYDFRLELDGVLKSWAVPKGPSLNPNDKRLAMMVEDHPFEYRKFEGIIPEGNYGAGTVMIWDEGEYHARSSEDREEGERTMKEGLEKGHISFVLKGKKLCGEFALIKIKSKEENAWMLLKKKDECARDDFQDDDRSVLTHRTLSEIASDRNRSLWFSNPAIEISAPKEEFPSRIKPMLATLGDKPFDKDGWIFEIKWDGYRMLAGISEKGVDLYSRNNLSFNEKFPALIPSLERIGHKAVLDGEVVVVDEKGKSHFQLLQNYERKGQGILIYYVFDLVHLDGYDIKPLPLLERKKLLRDILPDLPDVRFSEHIEREGKAFFITASKEGLEGIMAKNGKSTYQPERRSGEWLKIKISSRQEAVIGGFTEPRGSRKGLGALVLGIYEGNSLVYVGHTGGGSDQKQLLELRKILEPLIRPDSPFVKKPKTNAPVHWVEPTIVCEVSFREWTGDGRMRQPIFLGIREDKMAHEVVKEIPKDKQFGPEPPGGKETEKIEIAGHAVEINNPRKIYWPKEKLRKRDLVEYYLEIAPFILPHLKDRPESLHRHPNGISGEDFFQKNMEGDLPDWAETFPFRSETEEREIKYLLCQNEATLAYMANLGCIEINPWISRAQSPEKPDYCILDLDPENISFGAVVEVAQAMHEILQNGGVEHYCKTSGATGLHIAIPLGANYTYEQSRQFAEIIAFITHRILPKTTSLERSPKKRQKKVYLDFLQNKRGQTIAAPYCVRPIPKAPVSTPLEWREVNEGLDPKEFTMQTAPERFRKTGDLWKGVLGPGIDLRAALNRLSQAGIP